MLNYVLIIPFIAVQAFAKNLPTLFAGGLLTGIPFGVFSTLVRLSVGNRLGFFRLTFIVGVWVCV